MEFLNLRHAADLALERRVETIVFHVPPDHAFTNYLREQGCQVRTRVPRVGGGMARVINQTQTFEKICPELTQRLGESALAGWSGTIDVATDLETTRLVVRRGRLRVDKRRGRANVTLSLPQQRLTQLLFGFQPVSHVLTHGGAKLTGDRAGVIDALFPKGEPYVWLTDRF